MDERRQSPRRAGERREFRHEDGRRDTERPSRRRSLRRYLLPLVLLLLPLALGGVYRERVVVPRQERSALAGQVGAAVRSVLSETPLPGVSFPGAPAPHEVSPWSEKVHLATARRADFANACAKLPEGFVGVREVPALGRAGALCSFFLGEWGLARKRWEHVAAHGAPLQVAEAKIGLGLLAMEQGLQSTDRQDRLFAWDRAEALFRGASADSVAAPSASRNLAALSSLREQEALGLLGSDEVGLPAGGQPLGED